MKPDTAHGIESQFQIADIDPLTIMPICGRAKIGKSVDANTICEAANLYDNPLVGKLDLDEHCDRDFMRYHESVLAMPMRDFDDVTRIINKLPIGCSLALCDTPGAFQTFAGKVNQKRDFLDESNIIFVPIFVTLDQGVAGPLLVTWLEIFRHCDKAFVIQNVIEDPCGSDPKPLVLSDDIRRPADVKIIQMPYLHAPIANEMSRLAARIKQVLHGEIPIEESEILSMRSSRKFVSTWAMQAEEALTPLTGYIRSIIQTESSPKGEKPITKPAKP